MSLGTSSTARMQTCDFATSTDGTRANALLLLRVWHSQTGPSPDYARTAVAASTAAASTVEASMYTAHCSAVLR